jgi:DNA polymerase-3 subunit epsilon
MNSIILPPIRHTRQLIFDVETTGLLSKKTSITDQPHIIQLAFVCYDMEKKRIIKQYDSLIQLPPDVTIPPFVVELTGITQNMCQTQGKPIFEVLQAFYDAYMWCDGLIAHNMDFDENMILLEIERYRELIIQQQLHCLVLFSPMYEKMNNVERYCTMRKGTPICNIDKPSSVVENKTEKKPAKKWPKLHELYTTLFPNELMPVQMHNAMVDVQVCLRCYLKMRHSISP